MPLAHPVSGPPHVDVPVALLTVAAALVVAVTSTVLPRGRAGSCDAATAASWSGRLRPGQRATRAVAVALLALAVAAGRFGTTSELDNLAPALVVGLAWPVLTVVALLLPVWRWVDPWDALARVLVRNDDSAPGRHVWPAVLPALAWTWFLTMHPRPLDPRLVGLALLAHTTLTMAGCLLLGRRRWMSSGEPVGILLTWLTAVGRGGLRSGAPGGAAVLVGGVVGGLLFGLLRRTGAWVDLVPAGQAELAGPVGFGLAVALGAALVALGGRLGARLRDHEAVLRSSLPVLAGLVLVLAMERNRLTTSVQLLPALLGDPWGRGWDLLGAPRVVAAAPLGAQGLLVVQLVALGACLLVAAVLVARGTSRAARGAATAVLSYLAAVSVLVVALH